MNLDILDLTNFVVVDVEGNGQTPPDIVEIALQLFSNSEVSLTDNSSWLIRPPRKITHFARNIHGISNTDVANCPSWSEIRDEVYLFIKDKIIVAHNASVERKILSSHLHHWNPSVIVDTLKLARATWANLETYSLDGLCKKLSITLPNSTKFKRHRAGFDAYITAKLFLRLLNDNSASTESELFDICNIIRTTILYQEQGELF